MLSPALTATPRRPGHGHAQLRKQLEGVSDRLMAHLLGNDRVTLTCLLV